jgi:shikimate dehydrogenase
MSVSRSPEFRAACVIGWPVKHSRSPLIHGYWLERHGISGDYRREEVRPEDFASFVEQLPARGYVGANVTLPHKEAALRLADADERARAVGAANTLWLDGGRLRATNTDVEGFIANLDASAPGWDSQVRKAVVLGAGGSARAVVYGLLERGVSELRIVNRTRANAEVLRHAFGERVIPKNWSEWPALLADADLVVNTTSLGMTGQPSLEIDTGALPANAIVADLVYAPLRTTLLQAAQARGLRTADGLGMLLHQAIRGFSLWFGIQPEVTPELRALIEADLGRAA